MGVYKALYGGEEVIGLAMISLVVIALGIVMTIVFAREGLTRARHRHSLEGRKERIDKRRVEIRQRLKNAQTRRDLGITRRLGNEHPRMIALNGLVDNLQRQLDHENLRLEEIETERAIRDFERSNEIE